MSVVEGRDAESLARAARVLSVRLIYIYETLDEVSLSRVFGCLSVFGISARHHVVGLFGVECLADAAFQLFQGGMGTGR